MQMGDDFAYSDWVRMGLHDLLAQLRAKSDRLQSAECTELPSYMVLTNQFYYITDFLQVRNLYVHPNVQELMGYPTEAWSDLDFVGGIIHPGDRDFVVAFSLKSVRFTMENLSYIKKDLHCGTFSIDFRIRKYDGSYIRVNRLTSAVKCDARGTMTHAVSFFTDISHLKHDNHIRCCLIGNDLPEFTTDEFYRRYASHDLSEREKEIIRLLAYGLDGKTIAERLHISEHTVVSHRKNMLRKTNTKNAASLVKFASDNGLI
ncbi:MAG: LuxR C-terminal-related transcriptional regulator [Bacteroidales bacterium]